MFRPCAVSQLLAHPITLFIISHLVLESSALAELASRRPMYTAADFARNTMSLFGLWVCMQHSSVVNKPIWGTITELDQARQLPAHPTPSSE